MEKTPPNARERDLMIELMILRNALKRNVEASRGRFEGNAWRDIRLLETLVDKCQAAMLGTMPDKNVDYFYELSRKAELRVQLPGAIRGKTYSMIDNRDMATITEFAMRDQCGLCIKTGKEARDCPLRNALLTASPPQKIQRDFVSGCEYAEYAEKLIAGENVVL